MKKIIVILCLLLIAQPMFSMVVPSSPVESEENINVYSGGYSYATGHEPSGLSPVTKQAILFWVVIGVLGVILVVSIN